MSSRSSCEGGGGRGSPISANAARILSSITRKRRSSSSLGSSTLLFARARKIRLPGRARVVHLEIFAAIVAQPPLSKPWMMSMGLAEPLMSLRDPWPTTCSLRRSPDPRPREAVIRKQRHRAGSPRSSGRPDPSRWQSRGASTRRMANVPALRSIGRNGRRSPRNQNRLLGAHGIPN